MKLYLCHSGTGFALINSLFEAVKLTKKWGHPHNMYAERGRERVKPNAYDCVPGGGMGGVQNCVLTQKKFFWTTKYQNFSFFYTKEVITLLFTIFYRKV